jgi:alkanesulfonate monooxygenase SsuD/methylene tetrahydromethanopterin reductase-like flavin-dependent oxidoreductase (luciferase family)
MTDKKIILGMALIDGYGVLKNAWRAPQVDPGNYTSIEANIRYAQSAERGRFAFLFTPDFPAVRGDVEHTHLSNIIDPMIALTAISQATSHIGFVATGSTTFQEPFNHARQFKALDVLSHGRAGWNAVTTSDPTVAANYGKPVAGRAERYQRAHESIQIVEALWGSWKKDAWIKDQQAGRFIDPSRLQPINLHGQHVPWPSRPRNRDSPSSSPPAVRALTSSRLPDATPAVSSPKCGRSRKHAPSASSCAAQPRTLAAIRTTSNISPV